MQTKAMPSTWAGARLLCTTRCSVAISNDRRTCSREGKLSLQSGPVRSDDGSRLELSRCANNLPHITNSLAWSPLANAN